MNLGHVAPLVEDELGLLRIDRQRTALLTRPSERRSRFARGLERLLPRRRRLLLTGEDAVDPLVVKALVRADHRSVESRAHELRAVQLELDRDGQALALGHERAGVVGELLRQHRLDRARRIYAGPASARLDVPPASPPARTR